MNKTQLITVIAEKSGLTKKQAEAAINSFTETVTETLASGDKVALIGFGTFSVAERAARDGVNPSTGDKIQIAASTVVKWKTGAKLKEAVK